MIKIFSGGRGRGNKYILRFDFKWIKCFSLYIRLFSNYSVTAIITISCETIHEREGYFEWCYNLLWPTTTAGARPPRRHPPSGPRSCRLSPSEFEIPHFLNVRDFNLSRERLGNFSLIRPTISTAGTVKVSRTVQFSSHYFSPVIRQYGRERHFLDKRPIRPSRSSIKYKSEIMLSFREKKFYFDIYFDTG